MSNRRMKKPRDYKSFLQLIMISATFFVFIALGLLGIGFVYKFMPETNGRTLEEIEEYFRSRYGKDKTKESMMKAQ